MNLTQEQREHVRTWIESGDSLSDIQKKLTELLEATMTYMEVRFLVDDLGLDIKSNKSQAASIASESNADSLQAEGATLGDVSVTVSKIQRPGSLLSGSVTFSDGVVADWQIDSMGRLGVIPPSPEYKPSQEDVQAFQRELQHQLQAQGL
jgi:hypothetical protein